MTKLDVPQLAKELNALASVFGKPALSEPAMEVWFSTLREMSYEKIAKALIAWPRKGTRMPTPADIANAIEPEQEERGNYLSPYGNGRCAVQGCEGAGDMSHQTRPPYTWYCGEHFWDKA